MREAWTNSLQNHLRAGLQNAKVASLLPDVGATPGYQVISMKLSSRRILSYSYLVTLLWTLALTVDVNRLD